MNLNNKNIKTISYSAIVGDLLHYGHIQLLKFAESLSDYNVCGLLTDAAANELRKKIISNYRERFGVIDNLKCIDEIMLQDNIDPTENLKKLHKRYPAAKIILVHGNNWSEIPGEKYIKKIKGEIYRPPYYSRLADSKIVKEYKDKNFNYEFFTEHFKIDNIVYYESSKEDKTIISTKANTLKALQPLLKRSKIEKTFIFTVKTWKEDHKKVIYQIKKIFPSTNIVVRSSAINEDTYSESKAGAFKSILNVSTSNTKILKDSIEDVINNYQENNSFNLFNQILIQPQTEDIILSGVVFTRRLTGNTPYYAVNYDDETGKSDTVTSGGKCKSLLIYKYSSLKSIPEKWINLIKALKEIESIVSDIPLDIEFAIKKDKSIVIFQVRPLTSNIDSKIDDKQYEKSIVLLKNNFDRINKKPKHIFNNYTFMSDMAFWNPSEIIGTSPKPLDYSLYRYIITDSIWHKALSELGYNDVNPSKLMYQFGNKPYIDIRASFNSLLPQNLSYNIKSKIIKYYMEKLRQYPELHDKIEFNIAYTCYDFNIDKRIRKLKKKGLTKTEINTFKKSLIDLTNDIILNSEDTFRSALNKVDKMNEKRQSIVSNMNLINTSPQKIVETIKILLKDCKTYGTLPFSQIARLAFISKSLLQSLVKEEVISEKIYYDFMNSISTVSTVMKNDFDKLFKNEISKSNFLKKYGHLRPGTYDITIPRYDRNMDIFDKKVSIENSSSKNDPEKNEFKLNVKTLNNIKKKLKKSPLKCGIDELITFLRTSIKLRELIKFEFTRNLSYTLELIAWLGEVNGFSREETAFLKIDDIINMKRQKQKWHDLIYQRKSTYIEYNNIELPPIIFDKQDFEIIQDYTSKPNYITKKIIESEMIDFEKLENKYDSLYGKIVLLEKADPGYDWIFLKNIKGLITKYGGANSHMAIRCAEFNLPAAIGVGSRIYGQLKRADKIILNCNNQQINILY